MTEHLSIVPILLFSVIIHEMAHGWMALRLGDPTARDAGRLTLNPIPHIDIIGSIIVPVLSLVSAGRIFIAWAKPVPVNPWNFRDFRRDDLLVSVVGPLSNLLLALACSIMVILLALVASAVANSNVRLLVEMWKFFMQMFLGGVYLNVGLAVFNLIPVPPLDGSHVLASLLPEEMAAGYRRIGFIGIFFILLLMRVPAFNAALGYVLDAVFTPFAALIRLVVPLPS